MKLKISTICCWLLKQTGWRNESDELKIVLDIDVKSAFCHLCSFVFKSKSFTFSNIKGWFEPEYLATTNVDVSILEAPKPPMSILNKNWQLYKLKFVFNSNTI